MNEQQASVFLFDIIKEVKLSLSTAVIFFTMKDYAEGVISVLKDLRTKMMLGLRPKHVSDMITRFHLRWLQAVDELDKFKQHLHETPREMISKAIDFTIESADQRKEDFNIYIKSAISTLSDYNKKHVLNEIPVIRDMYKNLSASLQSKKNIINSIGFATDYYEKITDEAEELLNWLDILYDNLAIQFSKAIEFKCEELTSDLTHTLQEVIDEVDVTDPDALDFKEKLTLKKDQSIVLNLSEDLEIKNIVEKIQTFERRIEQLKSENSTAAVKALEHKMRYLEQELISLENLKSSLITIKKKQIEEVKIHIFEHLLPAQDRYHLVEKMMQLWNDAISGVEEKKSIISILSVADMIEQFSDEYGIFTIDRHGRKQYRGDDGKVYQLNDRNELVPIQDDKHIYFYDECGRYYIDDNKNRIYKAHSTASEYCLNRAGLLLKLKEYRDGKEYFFNSLGRYFISENGKKIYTDDDVTLFEHDGLGNLVRVRDSVSSTILDECPLEPITTEENKYLQRTVGRALAKCIAEVISRQPQDPVLYLAHSLMRYRYSEREKQKRIEEEVELFADRERLMREQYAAKTVPVSPCSVGEEEDIDVNFVSYTTPLHTSQSFEQ